MGALYKVNLYLGNAIVYNIHYSTNAQLELSGMLRQTVDFMDEIDRAYREVLAACLEEHPGR
jgi:hypothetical protein